MNFVRTKIALKIYFLCNTRAADLCCVGGHVNVYERVCVHMCAHVSM